MQPLLMSSPAQLSTIISKIAVYDKKYARHFSSVVEPEPDFFAGAGEKALSPGCCCVA